VHPQAREAQLKPNKMRKRPKSKRKKGRRERLKMRRKSLPKLRLQKREIILTCTFGSRQRLKLSRFYSIKDALKIAQMPFQLQDLNATALMTSTSRDNLWKLNS
jgi:hypothetical protein